LFTSAKPVEAFDQTSPFELREEAQDRPLRTAYKARDPRDRRERVRAIVRVRGQH